jgi:histidinol-phosphate aminotransferase
MLSKSVRELLEEQVEYPFARSVRGAKAREVIKLSSNENPLGSSPKAVEAIKRGSRRVNVYPDPKAEELKRAISGYLDVGEECIAIGNGSDELVDLICKAFMDPGDEVLIPLPTFSEYELACRINGGRPKFVELSDFKWDGKVLAKSLTKARLAFIGRPNNPTGNSISEGGLEELLATGKLVVVDEAYGEFAGYSTVGKIKKRDNLLVLRTFSKAFGLAGLRVGYVLGTPKLIQALERIRAPFSVNSLAQVAAVAALGDEKFLRRVKNVVKNGREYLQRELPKFGLRVLPSDANFIMANVGGLGTDAPSFCDFLARQGILIRDLSGFRGAGSNWVRITVGTPKQNKRLVSMIKRYKGGS